MSVLALKIPPPIVVLVCGAGMWLVAKYGPSIGVPRAARVAAALIVCALGISVMLAGVFSFRRAKTTTNPLTPNRSTALVTNGVYRYTRNPMYLGMLVVLVAWTVFLSSPVALVGPLAFWLYIEKFQILPEERALTVLFGSSFEDYTARVRRWL